MNEYEKKIESFLIKNILKKFFTKLKNET